MMMLLMGGEAWAVSLTSGLLGYWQFNGNGFDASGNGNNVSLFGGAGYTGAGLFGQALNLDGVQGSYAQQPINNTAFDLGSGDFTIQVWANLNSLSNVSGLNPVLIEKFSGASGPGWVFYVQQGSTIEFYSNGSLLLNPYESITLHVWHNYLVQRIGNTLNLFFDGSLVATTSFSGSLGASPNPLLIGAQNAEDGRNFTLDGSIDETAVWNRALSATEIASLWNGGTGQQITSSVVPEPSTWFLFATGCVGLLGVGWRQGRKKGARVGRRKMPGSN